MTDVADRLKIVRNHRGLSRSELAEASSVSVRQIARIESGKTRTPRESTIKRLADCLQVAPSELTGDRPSQYTGTASAPSEISETVQVGGEFLPEVRLAFDLVQLRYGWNEQRIIALAPLTFVLLVERCMLWQEHRLADLQDQLGRFDEQLFRRLRRLVGQDPALRFVDVDQQGGLPEHFQQIFGEYLSVLAADIPVGLVEPMLTDRWSGTQGRVCEEDLRRITGGSVEAQWALAYGDVVLDDIPDELMSDEAMPERVRWLEGRLSEDVKSMLRERHANGLPVGPMSIQKWRTNNASPPD